MVGVRKGDLVRIEYTGRIPSTGQVFDTTDESVAKQAGIREQGAKYGSKLAIFGANAIMAGMEEAILASQLGKEAEFLLPPDKAFGEKKQDLLRVLSEKEFSRHNLSPAPGAIVSLDGALARVKSVTSGRVVVDFNHPLAGESVLYSLKVIEVIADKKKKADAMLASLGIGAKVEGEKGKITVSLPKGISPEQEAAAKRAVLAVAPDAEFKAA